MVLPTTLAVWEYRVNGKSPTFVGWWIHFKEPVVKEVRNCD